jgi:hypothetical protein
VSSGFRFSIFVVSIVLCAAISGCAKRGNEPVANVAAANPSKSKEPSSPVLTEVHESVQKGAYDDAAARLVEMRAAGHEFSPREAADYRQALNEAYSRALEAAEKGDARAQEAIRIIRAGHPH